MVTVDEEALEEVDRTELFEEEEVVWWTWEVVVTGGGGAGFLDGVAGGGFAAGPPLPNSQSPVNAPIKLGSKNRYRPSVRSMSLNPHPMHYLALVKKKTKSKT